MQRSRSLSLPGPSTVASRPDRTHAGLPSTPRRIRRRCLANDSCWGTEAKGESGSNARGATVGRTDRQVHRRYTCRPMFLVTWLIALWFIILMLGKPTLSNLCAVIFYLTRCEPRSDLRSPDFRGRPIEFRLRTSHSRFGLIKVRIRLRGNKSIKERPLLTSLRN